MFKKIKIIDMPAVYTANAFRLADDLYIGCGPEKHGNPCIIKFPSLGKIEVGNSPGGMMSLIPVPGRTDMLVSVMGLFPPFQGKEGGIYRHAHIENAWNVTKVSDLPFAHRCEIIQREGRNYLFAATVSKDKKEPLDWSEPGELYFTVLDDVFLPVWEMKPVLKGLHRNHGMMKVFIESEETLCVSGTEGIFSLRPEATDGMKIIQLFDKEVSEFALIDLNNDGLDELVTIEPFHGDSLNIYKRSSFGWDRIFDTQLSFGHGLSSGQLAGVPVVTVGNRSGEASLELFGAFGDFSFEVVKRICVEKGVGPTQTQIFRYQNRDYILSANQLKNEVALYCLK